MPAIGPIIDAGHIKGAVNLYAADQDTWLPGFCPRRTRPPWSSPTATVQTVIWLRSLPKFFSFSGFDHVRYLKNGWSRWRDGGFPVD
jgi:hypothetical protein